MKLLKLRITRQQMLGNEFLLHRRRQHQETQISAPLIKRK